MHLHARLVVVAAVVSSLPDLGAAQVRASEAATISQTVDGTVITVTYSRPQARGRDPLFGGLVHYGETWTPGANWATTLEVTKDVHVNGQPVAKGTYAVWAVPDSSWWTIILDPDARRFHTQRPRASESQIRFSAAPDSVAFTEVLTWEFPTVRRDGTTLRLRWGTVAIPLDIAVPPTGRGRLTGVGHAYVGTYRLWLAGPVGDSSAHQANIVEQDDELRLRITPNPFPETDAIIRLQRTETQHEYRPAFLRDGRVVDGETGTTLVFLMKNGRAEGLELRGVGDRLMAKGERQ